METYNPVAGVCVGVPFGHTRPQWLLPYGGLLTLDGEAQTITADYGAPTHVRRRSPDDAAPRE